MFEFICIGVVSLFCGVGTAYLIVSYMASSLRSVHVKYEAGDYLVENSLDVTYENEVFRNKKVEKIAKNNNNN